MGLPKAPPRHQTGPVRTRHLTSHFTPKELHSNDFAVPRSTAQIINRLLLQAAFIDDLAIILLYLSGVTDTIRTLQVISRDRNRIPNYLQLYDPLCSDFAIPWNTMQIINRSLLQAVFIDAAETSGDTEATEAETAIIRVMPAARCSTRFAVLSPSGGGRIRRRTKCTRKRAR